MSRISIRRDVGSSFTNATALVSTLFLAAAALAAVGFEPQSIPISIFSYLDYYMRTFGQLIWGAIGFEVPAFLAALTSVTLIVVLRAAHGMANNAPNIFDYYRYVSARFPGLSPAERREAPRFQLRNPLDIQARDVDANVVQNFFLIASDGLANIADYGAILLLAVIAFFGAFTNAVSFVLFAWTKRARFIRMFGYVLLWAAAFGALSISAYLLIHSPFSGLEDAGVLQRYAAIAASVILSSILLFYPRYLVSALIAAGFGVALDFLLRSNEHLLIQTSSA